MQMFTISCPYFAIDAQAYRAEEAAVSLFVVLLTTCIHITTGSRRSDGEEFRIKRITHAYVNPPIFMIYVLFILQQTLQSEVLPRGSDADPGPKFPIWVLRAKETKIASTFSYAKASILILGLVSPNPAFFSTPRSFSLFLEAFR